MGVEAVGEVDVVVARSVADVDVGLGMRRLGIEVVEVLHGYRVAFGDRETVELKPACHHAAEVEEERAVGQGVDRLRLRSADNSVAFEFL